VGGDGGSLDIEIFLGCRAEGSSETADNPLKLDKIIY
jgi:hypothetical protein